MASATLNLSVVEKRMLSTSDAAAYCGIPVKHFKKFCPVAPMQIAGKFELYDKRDLDDWIDSEKTGYGTWSQAAILEKLL